MAVEFLAMRLFPRISDVLGLRQIGADSEESWRGNLRVCAEELFPIYFQLAIPLGAISNADLQSRLEHLDDPNQFAAILLELARDSRPDAGARLRAFLERLETHVGDNATGEEVASALRALFQAADDLLRREDQRGVEGPIDIQTQLRRIIRRFVSQIEPGERVELLESTFAAEGSLACAVDTVVMLGQEHGKYGGEWREGAATVVSLSQLAQLENLALTFVRDAAAEERMLRTPRMPEVLQCWATWNRGECRSWVVAHDRERQRPARLPRPVHARGRLAQRERPRHARLQPARPAPPPPLPRARLDRLPRQGAVEARAASRSSSAP